MKNLAKQCNLLQIEEKWQQRWEEMKVYRFDWSDKIHPVFSINTPPPYPSGDFHMGNVLNWTYFDIVARYKRMQGYNVLFPQGWDCHGLPTEVETEEEYGIRKKKISPLKFIELCKKFVNKYIDIMKKAVIRLGCSIDWTTEYKTMDPDYWRRTQLSFLLLHKKGMIYQGMHPINWCPSCETAIADAEVEHESMDGTLYYIKFELRDGDYLTVATTRPELLPSCVTVAVNANDKRYQKYRGKEIRVPVAGRRVKIIQDDLVDPEFGTGVVMICTYGDKADVECVVRHHLQVVMCIDEKGRMNKKAGEYSGLTILEARNAVVADLERDGLIVKTEQLKQEIGVCWRCKSPIEILERKQWFMKTRDLAGDVKNKTLEITWYPDYMKNRLIDWAKSLDWDWVISRQRIFATPIPIWYCQKCGVKILAETNWIPIDPRSENPKIEGCPACNSSEFIPETDVLDTWFDSSITCAVHAGWPDRRDWERFFPADLHTSGYDIIRTWAYYLMVRHLALFDQKPYRSVLINGMVLGSDGRKMSKSLGNYITTLEVLSKYGADSCRQWAANGGATGSDIPFRWSDVEYGWRFLIKLWNAARFASLHLQDYNPQEKGELNLLDKWLLSRMEKVTQTATKAYENCNFNVATGEIRNFAWHELCDLYFEATKHRLYKPETYGKEKRKGAQYTLYTTLYRTLQLLSPITPHITEEIYQLMYSAEKKHVSIHTSPWPTSVEENINEEAEGQGNMIMALIREIRRDKAEKEEPLNKPIKKVIICSEREERTRTLNQAADDIAGTCKIEQIEILTGKREGKEVEGYPHIRFISEY